MCVLALAWQAHPHWQLVLAGNRDEFHARPAAPLARWKAPPHLLAGRDLQAGGTWLGVSEQGRLAVVTNRRGYGPPRPDAASRGALVTDLLSGNGDPGLDTPQLAGLDLARFNPFNLIVADRRRALYLTNQPEPTSAQLAPGVYGLSNGALDEPWPKTMQLKSAMLDWLMRDEEDVQPLFAALASRALPEIGMAPRAPSDVPQEPPLSPIFIENPVYGTRCSTVVLIDAAGNGRIIERRFDADGGSTGETELRFRWAY